MITEINGHQVGLKEISSRAGDERRTNDRQQGVKWKITLRDYGSPLVCIDYSMHVVIL